MCRKIRGLADLVESDPVEFTKRSGETDGEFVRFDATIHPSPDGRKLTDDIGHLAFLDPAHRGGSHDQETFLRNRFYVSRITPGVAGLSNRVYYVLVVLVAARVGWAVWEFVFRNYGPGSVDGPLLLDATPQAAAAAAIAWIVTTFVLVVLGVALVRWLRGTAG